MKNIGDNTINTTSIKNLPIKESATVPVNGLDYFYVYKCQKCNVFTKFPEKGCYKCGAVIHVEKFNDFVSVD